MNQDSATGHPYDKTPAGLLRRQILRAAAAVPGAATVTALMGCAVGTATSAGTRAAPRGRSPLELVLLGTAAGPVPMPGRTGVASALVVEDHVYLIDVGHGAFEQFDRAGLALDKLVGIFVTHLHSDHLADLYSLLWLRFGGAAYKPLTHPVDIYGPGRAGALPTPNRRGTAVPTVNPTNPTPGMKDFIKAQIAATAYDINIRMRDQGWPDIRELLRPHDIALPHVGASPVGRVAPPMDPFVVMSDERVRVSAILVEHPPVFPSYAFRFDTAHGSVVFSGDTSITRNMVTLARGADVLVHEAIDLETVQAVGNLTPDELQHHQHSHADVARLGSLGQEAGVKMLVLNHLAPGVITVLPDKVWHEKASRGFDGRVIVGRDLMRIGV